MGSERPAEGEPVSWWAAVRGGRGVVARTRSRQRPPLDGGGDRRPGVFVDGDRVRAVDGQGAAEGARTGSVVDVCPVPPGQAGAVGARVLVAVAWPDGTIGIHGAAELRHCGPARPARSQDPRPWPSTSVGRAR